MHIVFYLLQTADAKKQRTEGVLLDAEDLAFLGDSAAPSPAISEQSSQMVSGVIDDESSNEALVVDCESPSSSSTPGKWNIL